MVYYLKCDIFSSGIKGENTLMNNKLRAPAVPLVVINPDLSLWSFADKLTDDCVRHWSGSKNNLLGLIEVDNRLYRFMGVAYSDNLYPETRFEAMNQVACTITPMQTVYEFECEEIKLKLVFTSPLFTDDLDVLSRPVSYVDYEILSNDGKEHTTKLAFMMNSEVGGYNHITKDVKIIIESPHGFTMGPGEDGLFDRTYDQEPAGCGYYRLYCADEGKGFVANADRFFYTSYTGSGHSIDDLKLENPGVVTNTSGFYAGWEKEYTLSPTQRIQSYMCIGFDDIYAMEYFSQRVKLYCYRNGETFDDIFKKAFDEHDKIINKAASEGQKIITLAKSVSSEYADIISLAYRQVIAAHKLTWCDDQLQFISKECASNGCVATVDITYPSMPMFLLLNPKLVEGMLNPIMRYALSNEWPYDFAPHDLGQYPKANRQVYGCRSEKTSKEHLEDPNNRDDFVYAWQMPVEESGNMIICIAAMCKAMGDYSYAKKYYDTLTKWVDYLLKCGYDPEHQLCTDDFAGRLAHNCNLSIKSIVGIACFGHITEMLGMDGKPYFDIAKMYARDWKTHADDGTHYRLAFDKEGSWSLKYNLIWDRLFGFGLFDDEIIDKEIANYKKQMTTYGVPLDNRKMWGKTDWQMWSAALRPGSDYEKMVIGAMHRFINESPSRVPFADWIECDTGKCKRFQSRSVQGGLFINLLARDGRFVGGGKNE